jgi:DNA-directed RNA polymerase I subunit RPA12
MSEEEYGSVGSQTSSTFPFCPSCGTILKAPDGEMINCSFCPYEVRFADLALAEVTTRSAPKSKPAWLTDNEEGKSGGDDVVEKEKHAKIDEPCPKCGNPELYFYTMQLRSVDEGSTVFYECGKCAHKFSQNN